MYGKSSIEVPAFCNKIFLPSETGIPLNLEKDKKYIFKYY